MSLIELDLNGLAEVNGGKLNLMFKKAVDRMANDLEVAPDHTGWRTVTIKVKAKPIMEDLELAFVELEYEVDGRTPSRVTSNRGLVRRNQSQQRKLVYNQDSPDSPYQQSLLNGEEETPSTEANESNAQ